MTDNEFIEMSRLLESLIKGSDTLRVLFPGEVTDKVRSHPLFKARWVLLDQAENEVKDLVGLINGCEDWTTDKFKASEIYRMMRGFVSVTSKMPVGISGLFKDVRSLCQRPMEIIPGAYPDLYPAFVRSLLNDGEYEKAKDFGQIIPPFNWTESIKALASWLDDSLLLANRNRIIKTKEGPKCCNDWQSADCIFWKDGEPVTAEQLQNAIKH